ncbi:MAG: hypothetical protein K9N07_00650 [Candidatus Cloacimonetes bacterium]|nr:hypothetical protein [Candidatus Cloacimonadota bacterium]
MNIVIKIFGIIIFALLISCTQKDNIVGAGGQLNPINTTISFSDFVKFYSFEDSCAYNNSNNIVIGNYENETAYGLLRFTSLPDSFYEVSNVKISLELKERNNFESIDNTNLKLARVDNIEWYENATWWAASDSTSWSNGINFSEDDYTDLLLSEYSIVTTEDSINIVLENSILEDWINADLNSGIVMYTEDDGFINLYSSEYGNDQNPVLSFEYKATQEDSLFTKNVVTCYDCMIYETDNNYEYWEDVLKISNIQPIQIYTKFNIPESAFIDVLPPDYVIENADTSIFLQRLTINRAELILQNNDVNAYPLSSEISLSPFLVLADTLNLTDPSVPLLIPEDIDDIYISSTTSSVDDDNFVIGITKIIQYYISGEYENNGILLKSLNMNQNFIHTEFNLEPQINIVFTPPIISE